jgi:predicted dinucleotide-binding enzyme
MKIGVLGTGTVGAAVATKLVEIGHEVRMGAREAGNEKARRWASGAGRGASQGTFADAASFGEIVFNCTLGTASLDALRAAGAQNLKGKILVDVSNPLDFSKGMPPVLTTPQGDSQGESIQRAFPDARVVKTLNTVNAGVMGHPERVGGESDLFLCGNDAEAKSRVRKLLTEMGWKGAIDLGDLKGARGMEAYLLLWLPLWGALGTPDFNVRIVRAGGGLVSASRPALG